MSSELPPISATGLLGCIIYLHEATTSREPDPLLIAQGLPQGRIRSAALHRDSDGPPHFAVVLRDQRTGQDRTPRLLDAEGLLVLRLLLLAKARVRVDRTTIAPRPEFHYVTLHDDIIATRVLSGAGQGQEAKYVGDHHDLRRRNLRIVRAAASIRQDREVAIGRAMQALNGLNAKRQKRAEAAGRAYDPMITPERYRWLLAEAFALLDKLPLAKTAE